MSNSVEQTFDEFLTDNRSALMGSQLHEVVRLQDQQFSVYRFLSGPESSRNMFQKAMFPLKPDLQKYYHREEHKD